MRGLFSVRIAACLNACQHLSDAELSHGPVASAAQRSQLVDKAEHLQAVIEATRDQREELRAEAERLRAALYAIVNKACTRPVHVDSCDRPAALVLAAALDAGRAALGDHVAWRAYLVERAEKAEADADRMRAALDRAAFELDRAAKLMDRYAGGGSSQREAARIARAAQSASR